MWDQYDIRFGTQKQTKELTLYYLWLLFINTILVYHFLDWHHFVHFQVPYTYKEAIGTLAAITTTGMIGYSLILFLKIKKDIKHFKKHEKKYLFIGDQIHRKQKSKALNKIMARIEMYSIISRPRDIDLFEKIDQRTWLYYVKLLGTKEEIDAKIFYLQRLSEKIDRNQPLNKHQKEYINELLFSNEDYELLKRIQRDLEKANVKMR